jgi:hypothetical protein
MACKRDICFWYGVQKKSLASDFSKKKAEPFELQYYTVMAML